MVSEPSHRPLVISVDFDGIIVKPAYPDIGETDMFVVKCLKTLKNHGAYIILNTCRWGEPLDDAVEHCRNLGLEFDAVNANLDHMIARWGECRKLGGDIYIDDRDICHGPIRMKFRLWTLATFYHTICKRYKSP